MEYVVQTHDLTRKFGDFIAVNKLNIKIKPGEIYGFLGPNGAGKSTAIRMLCGILQPTFGSAKILGYDLLKEPEQIKRNIGYMSQKFSLYEDLTVSENLNFYAGVYGVTGQEKKIRIAEMIEMAGLKGREHELAVNLSGGWKQRLALGCAILSRPALLFLDEPTSGVSPTSRRMFFDLIHELAQKGTTIMVTTHFMDEAERCHQIAFISGGTLMEMDTPKNLKEKVLKGILVELALPDALSQISAVESLPYVLECTNHGSLLHVLLENSEQIKDLHEFTGVVPQPIIPSLEDVFIALAKRQREAEK